MKFTIEGKQYDIPTSLSDITLADRVSFDELYGRDMRERLAKISDMLNNIDRELELGEYQADLACKSVSFFGRVPLEVIQNTALDQVIILHQECLNAMVEEYSFNSEEFEIQHEIKWNNETWVIAPPELKNTSSMTFGEFLDAKQWVKNLFTLSNQRWESLVMLCCVYLRKKGEPYSEALSEENGERYKLLKTLPLPYALNVGFFLSDSMSSYIRASNSFNQVESPEFQS